MRFYLSHPIRGKKGNNATKKDMDENNKNAIMFGDYVRSWHPVELYVPAEHEDFIQLALEKGWLSIDQVLEVDGIILSKCDGVIFYLPDGLNVSDSEGMLFEKCVAQAHEIPWVEVMDTSYNGVDKAIKFLISKV